MVSINSTLVETVSINYEDFNESFLTCGTCLCVYDGAEHIPKLLPCSHTVCLHCLLRIATSHSREIGAFRCPICRELINIPRGGVSALPPSFLVNQLLDLMSRQQRHVIPKCSVHSSQELLFCETCDLVFCSLCTNGASHNLNIGAASVVPSNNSEHTIVPFSIAIKRMSEILLYKSNECLIRLSKAKEAVSNELKQLETSAQDCLQNLEKSFQDITSIIDKRKRELIDEVQHTKAAKKEVLEEQLSLIEDEKQKVEEVCEGLHYQVEVRTISQRISSLSGKLDNVSILIDPRENSYLRCDVNHESRLQQLKKNLFSLGKVITSTTFPGLSYLHAKDSYVKNLESVAVLKTVDYHGNPRVTGGDPVSVILHRDVDPESIVIKTEVIDNDDGTYHVKFRPTITGRYCLKINVLGRPIKNSSTYFKVTDHNSPVCKHGFHGSGKDEYIQPVAVAVDNQHMIYVVDTGNSRIKVLTEDLEFVRHIDNPGLVGRACTGIDVFSSMQKNVQHWIVIVNWRSKVITRMNMNGETIVHFTHNLLHEPIDVAVDKSGTNIFVADNGCNCIFVFDTYGSLLLRFGRKGNHYGCFNLLSSICVGNNDEIVAADSRIQIFSSDGIIRREISPESKSTGGRYGGVVVDSNGLLIATRSDKARHYIQVFDMNTGELVNVIDSYSSKLRRPSGIAATDDNHAIVVDLGNDCVKKYCYW